MKTSRILWVGFLCAMALASAVSAASAANLLGNPAFETGALAPWAGVGGVGANSTITVLAGDNGPSAPGTHYAFVNNQQPANGLTMAQTTATGTAVPGPVYYAFDLSLGSALNGGVFFVEIFAQNSVGAVIGGSGLLGNFSPGVWTTYTGTFVAPANTDHLTSQVEAPTGAVVGSVSSMKVDNVSLTQDNPTPVNRTTWGRVKNLYR